MSSTRPSWDYILKFIIIGDASVGKSSLLVRLTEDRFLVDSDATIGIEFGSHIISLESGERLKLQVWDTAGSEQFRSVCIRTRLHRLHARITKVQLGACWCMR